MLNIRYNVRFYIHYRDDIIVVLDERQHRNIKCIDMKMLLIFHRR